MQASIQAPTNPNYPPACDTLFVDSFNGIPYSYRWALAVSSTTAGTPASGTPGQLDYVPAVADVTTYNQLIQGNGSLTEKQWTDWTTQPDSYVLDCAADNLGVILV